MADENIKQVMQDAILDADSLEQFINGSEDETVLTRLSAEYPTLQKALKELFENGGIADRFKTLAELQVSPLVDGDYALVADDTEPDNNGLYVKEGGTWVKSKYDMNSGTSSAIDMSDVTPSFYDKQYRSYNLYNSSAITRDEVILSSGEISTSIGSAISDYIKVEGGNSYYADGFRHVNLYDKFRNFIERVQVSYGYLDGVNRYYEVISIPENCHFVRLSFQYKAPEYKGEGRLFAKGESEMPFVEFITPVLVNDISAIDAEKALRSLGLDISEILETNGYNLFDASDVTVGEYVTSSGGAKEEVGYSVSGFIPVEPNARYTITGGRDSNAAAFVNVSFYDKDKEFLYRLGTNNKGKPMTITSADTARYVRLNINAGPASSYNRMIVKGSEVLPYMPYKTPKISAELSQKRMSDIKEQVVSGFIKLPDNLFNPSSVTEGVSISSLGELIESETYSTSDFIKVEAGVTYAYSFTKDSLNAFLYTATYDADKNFIERLFTPGGENGKADTFVFNDGVEYIRVALNAGRADQHDRMINIGDRRIGHSSSVPTLKDVDVPFRHLKKGGETLHFTGDKHTPAILDFADSYSKDDERNISTAGEPVTYVDMVTWWGDLANEFPDYITKELVGYDSSGQLEIHSYHFSPPIVRGDDTVFANRTRPRVMLIAFHIEQMNQLYPYLAMRELCRSWRDSPALAALRHEVEFMVIPYAHPYGFGNDYRLTSEGLNTNGDFPYQWSKVEGEAPNGDTPFATSEMRTVKKVAEKFKPHVFLDLHSNFASADGSGLWSVVGYEDIGYKDSIVNAVTSLYPELLKVDAEAPAMNDIARVTFRSLARMAPGYGFILGAHGGLVEIAKNYKGRPYTDGIYNDGLIFGSSVLLSIITQCIASYRDNGSPLDPDKYGTYDEILAEYGLSRDE